MWYQLSNFKFQIKVKNPKKFSTNLVTRKCGLVVITHRLCQLLTISSFYPWKEVIKRGGYIVPRCKVQRENRPLNRKMLSLGKKFTWRKYYGGKRTTFEKWDWKKDSACFWKLLRKTRLCKNKNELMWIYSLKTFCSIRYNILIRPRLSDENNSESLLL